MKYLSVCSGIEAATVAWHPLGWMPVGFSEIEKFPCDLLAWRYPNVPNFGDMTKFKEWPDLAIDLLVGGTPCQSFSVAGLRAGLDDPRGNLALTYLAIADRYKPRWLAWENVPGVLSIDKGRAFGAILGGMVKLGYGVAYRILDAQFCRTLGFAGAVPQRRRRVLVIGYLGDWRRAAAVLFDGASLRGDPAPGRRSGQNVARALGASAARRGGLDDRGDGGHGNLIPAVANPLTARMVKGVNTTMDEGVTMVAEPFFPDVAATLPAGGNATGGDRQPGTSAETAASMLLPIPFDTTQITHPENRSNPQPDDPAGTLPKAGHAPTVAFHASQDPDVSGDVTHPMGRNQGQELGIFHNWRVRRLTPTECERLQGFPDGYTQIPRGNKPTADGPRYKALGNSMAVNVMRVLGQRIDLADAL